MQVAVDYHLGNKGKPVCTEENKDIYSARKLKRNIYGGLNERLSSKVPNLGLQLRSFIQGTNILLNLAFS